MNWNSVRCLSVLSVLMWTHCPLMGGEPALRLDFDTKSVGQVERVGGVHFARSGPQFPEFPAFGEKNQAVELDGNGARLVIADQGENSALDFTNGNSITLEAWVDLAELNPDENRYVIGKGRTHDAGFSKVNQNWALRVRGVEDRAHVSFLFATTDNGSATWHRWTSHRGFRPETGWHHIAVTYVFGQPESVAAWIDGKKSSGTWDMAGATEKAPVVDNDAVWVGSAMGGSSGNSFSGLLDNVAVHREIVPDNDLAARFFREGPPRELVENNAAPQLGEIPPGRVLLLAHEGLKTHTRWPRRDHVTEPGSEITRLEYPHFYLPRLPFRYDDWGIRASWKAPVLTTMAADIPMTPGKHRLVVRTRGLSRLWIDGDLVLETAAHNGASDGHGPVPPVPEPPAPGLVSVGYGDHEDFVEIDIAENTETVRVILQSIVGGKKLRAVPGEMLVAVEDSGTYKLLAARGGTIVMDKAGLRIARNMSEARLRETDAVTRHQLAMSQDAFWHDRHDFARDYVANHPDAPHRSIDSFLAGKIEQAIVAARDVDPEHSDTFYKKVLPIVRTNCFRCHGEKEKGDLRLDSRDSALAAIAPGDPGKSELIYRITTGDEEERMPPKGEGLSSDEKTILSDWVMAGAPWPAPPIPDGLRTAVPVIDDASFLRRVSLDTVGVPPSENEVRAFLADSATDKRNQKIDQLLRDSRFADHWVSYWQDMLAENPNMLKPSLNNTGPFRWFLHEALRDNKPLDRMVSELIMLRGSPREGGSAGFGLATDNDSPFAAKAHVLGTAFLGIEMQCARCHDAPYHSIKQRDLYSVAAMLNRKSLAVPESSTVPAGFLNANKGRQSLIKVTLAPGEPVLPQWPFAKETGTNDHGVSKKLACDPNDPRALLAAQVTSPANTRFARVMVNRLWRRLIGAGLVEPVHDWEGKNASHPALLDWLAIELVTNGYDQKHILRLILRSKLYAREAVGHNRSAAPEQRFFRAPDRRRLTAEQVVDSLYTASARIMDVEELTFDPDGRRPAQTMISFGHPRRAWEFASLSNERDRPSLALPKAQAVSDVLEAFGWPSARQGPVHDRESAPNILQPGVLANSTLSTWITQAGDGSDISGLALAAETPESLVDTLFLRFLTRFPGVGEKAGVMALIAPGFESRRVPDEAVVPNKKPKPLRRVAWTNHLHPDANSVKLIMEKRAREGVPPDPRLRPDWRERYEDVIWSLVNTPEFVWIP